MKKCFCQSWTWISLHTRTGQTLQPAGPLTHQVTQVWFEVKIPLRHTQVPYIQPSNSACQEESVANAGNFHALPIGLFLMTFQASWNNQSQRRAKTGQRMRSLWGSAASWSQQTETENRRCWPPAWTESCGPCASVCISDWLRGPMTSIDLEQVRWVWKASMWR